MAESDSNTVYVLTGNPCKECGGDVWTPLTKAGIKRKKVAEYCSQKCRFKARDKLRPARPQSSRKWHDYTCKECGNAFRTQRTDSVYCSNTCNGKAAMRKAIANGNRYKSPEFTPLPEYSSVYQVRCPACGDKRMSKYERDTPCCTPCVSLMSARNKVARLAESRTCEICNIQYSPLYGNKSKQFCSVECANENNRISKRRCKAKRRAIERYAASAELFDPIDVLKRDGWTCQSCGCDTPSKLRGTRHDDAPELDHIIPLAKGGTHTMANTQCLCRICNQMKSDMMPQEFIEWKQGGRVVFVSAT